MLYIKTDVKFVQRENDLKVDFFILKLMVNYIANQKTFQSCFIPKHKMISSHNRLYIIETSHPTPSNITVSVYLLVFTLLTVV